MRQELNTFTEKLHRLQGQRDLLNKQLVESNIHKANFQRVYEDTLKARAIVQNVASETQKQIEYHISNLVTMALASVFPDPWEFKLRFVQRRNKTEADLIFIKRGNEVDDILDNGGGGVADVASMALRFALWSIKKSRATMILDESTKFLHNISYQEKTSDLLKEVSEKLRIQIIMVSDQKAILKAADKVIEIINVDGEAKVLEE